MNLLSSITETPIEEESGSGFTVMRISIGGEPHGRAIVDAVNAAYPRIEDPTAALDAIGEGGKFTVIRGGENQFGASGISADEGKLFRSRQSDDWAYLPKGKRTQGYRIEPAKVLDVLPGWDIPGAGRRVADVRATFPQVRELTAERLRELHSNCNTCSIAVFGTLRFGQGVPGAIWLLHEGMASEDIVEGYLFVPPNAEACSEHGSAYGRDLINMGGEVMDFAPMHMKDVCDMEYADVLAAITTKETANA